MTSLADTILLGAEIVTLASGTPKAQALAIRQGRIVAVGDERSVLDYRSARTDVVHLQGRTITPGLIDAHAHPGLGATRAIGADFSGVTDPDAALGLLRAEATKAGRSRDASWVRAHNLDYALFQRLPMTADAIAPAVADQPALLYLYDGHTALVSHAALQLAGINSEESFADASRVVVDADGTPTGELRGESAIARVLSVIPMPTTAEQVNLVHGVLRRLSASGLTGVCIMDGTPATLDLLAKADSVQAGLPLRVVSAIDHAPGDDETTLHEHLAMRDRRGARWRGGLVKLYADGVVETGSSWLYQPDTSGGGQAPFWNDPAAFRETVRRYHNAGFQIATHAIGDHAIGATIEAYRAAGPPTVSAPSHRIEHLECMADRDLSRMAAAGIAASLQPLHMQWRRADGSDDWSTRLGPERARKAWRVRDLIRAGVLVALGSDWPVAQFDPRIGMAWARLRRTPGIPDAHVFEPDQVLTPFEALLGYTRWAAKAQGDPDTGIIRVGARADLSIWDENPLRVDADQIPHLPIHATVMDGRTTFRSAEATIG